MIPANAITSWASTAPWQTRAQVEQDLLLSRLIVEIANHPYLGQELIFRGGTCLHKLQLPKARRYSEDLVLDLNPADIIRSFRPYQPSGLTSRTAAANLRAKLQDAEFRNDLSLLVTSDPIDYDIDLAADLVITSLHDRL